MKLPMLEQVKKILETAESRSLSLEEIAQLLEIGKHKNVKAQFNLLREFVISQYREKNSILRHIAPIYLSSCCIDTCKYCNYSAVRKDVKRARLSLKDLKSELDYVLAHKNRVVEFTLATDPSFTAKKLARYVSLAKKMLRTTKGHAILLCSDYFSKEEYETLKKAGLRGMVQWDETLDRKSFETWHKNSPRKFDFKKRIDTHDRAVQAGLQVATGCLFGLSDYRYDVLMQIAKARYLYKKYGVRPFVFGTPRLKSIGGNVLHTPNEVNDLQYELALMVYKIAEPQTGRWLQTRETPELNLRNMAHGDFYTYKCGDVTPGGYSVNKKVDTCKGGQFKVNEMSQKHFHKELRKRRFKVSYAWA